MYSGVIGFFVPVLISVIVQTGWSDRAKAIAAFLVSLAAGAGTAYFSGNFDGRDVVTCALITLTVGISTYYGFWKPIGVAPAIQAATTFGTPAAAAPVPTSSVPKVRNDAAGIIAATSPAAKKTTKAKLDK